MKPERLIDAIGELDDALIDEARRIDNPRKRRGIGQYLAIGGSLAACIAVIALAFSPRWLGSGDTPGGPGPQIEQPEVTAETAGPEQTPESEPTPDPVIEPEEDLPSFVYRFNFGSNVGMYNASHGLYSMGFEDFGTVKVLPVYEKPVLNGEEMVLRIQEVTEIMGIDLLVVTGTDDEAVAEKDGVYIRIQPDGNMTIEFFHAEALPEALLYITRELWSGSYMIPDSNEERKMSNEMFARLLGLAPYTKISRGGSYDENNQFHYQYASIENRVNSNSSDEDKAKMITDYVFGSIYLYAVENGSQDDPLWRMEIGSIGDAISVGNHPLITAQQAYDLLLEGCYLTDEPYILPDAELVRYMDLTYHIGTFEGKECYLPYYRFWTDDEAVLYVPAIENHVLPSVWP